MPDDWIHVSDHAALRWTQRANATVGPRVAWFDAQTITADHGLYADEARYHPDTDTVLIRKDDTLVTVIPVSDSRPRLQQAVRRLGDVATINRGEHP